MLKNYLKTAFRNLIKTKQFSLINILGLAIGMAACLLILKFVNFEQSYDKFNTKNERIYRLRYERTSETGETVHFSSCCPPLGLRIRESFPEVEKVGRIWRYIASVSYKENVFIEERMFFAEPDFFEIFNYKFISGDPTVSLKEPGSAFISESTAKKYFGDESPVGRSFSVDKKIEYQVKGVFKDIPKNSHLKFDIILAWSNLYDIYGKDIEDSWGDTGAYTYLLFKKGANISVFQENIKKLVNSEIADMIKEYKLFFDFPLQELTEIHLNSHFQQEYEVNGDKETVVFLKIIAFLIIIIAWVNYVNLSTAQSLTRAKEVGLRKVVGASKFQVIIQLFIEIIIINTIAVLLAWLFVELAKPLFSNLTGIPINPTLWTTLWFWKTLLLMFAAGVILSGFYPVFIISSFKPISIIKGKLKSGVRGINTRRTLVAVQFIISIILLTTTFAVFEQIAFMKNQSLGFSKNQIIAVRAPRVRDIAFKSQLSSFKSEVLKNPQIEIFCVLTETPGKQIYWDAGGIFRVGSSVNKNYQIVGIDYEFVNLFETKIIAGRNFSLDFPADTNALILNETAVKWMEFPDIQSAVGGQVSYWGQIFNVVGVMQDYHQQSPKAEFEPHIYRLLPYGRGVRGFFAFKINKESTSQTLKEIQNKYFNYFPGNPFDFYFLDDYYNQQYSADVVFGKVFGVFSFLAIIITSMGILGLFSFMVVQRTKEISIRKVVGADISNIFILFSRDFIWLLVVSFIMALPTCYYIITTWLDSFALKMNLSIWLFLLPLLLIFVASAITTTTQILKVIKTKAIDTLRYE